MLGLLSSGLLLMAGIKKSVIWVLGALDEIEDDEV